MLPFSCLGQMTHRNSTNCHFSWPSLGLCPRPDPAQQPVGSLPTVPHIDGHAGLLHVLGFRPSTLVPRPQHDAGGVFPPLTISVCSRSVWPCCVIMCVDVPVCMECVMCLYLLLSEGMCVCVQKKGSPVDGGCSVGFWPCNARVQKGGGAHLGGIPILPKVAFTFLCKP